MIVWIQHHKRWSIGSIRWQGVVVHRWYRIHPICHIWKTSLRGVMVQWTILWLVCRILVTSVRIPWSIRYALTDSWSVNSWVWSLTLVAIVAATSGSWFWIMIPVSFSVPIVFTSIVAVVTPSSAWRMSVPCRNLLNMFQSY